MWKIQRSLVSEILPLDDESVILFGLVIKVHFVSIGCLNIASEVQLNITTLIKAGVELKTGWWDGEMGGGGGRGLEIEFLRSYIDLTARVMENSWPFSSELYICWPVICIFCPIIYSLLLMTGYNLIPVD